FPWIQRKNRRRRVCVAPGNAAITAPDLEHLLAGKIHQLADGAPLGSIRVQARLHKRIHATTRSGTASCCSARRIEGSVSYIRQSTMTPDTTVSPAMAA